MAGDRQLVRRAVAAYFGGTQVPGDQGICYQNGPLASAGLGTAYPYQVKGVPDPYYFAGMPPGQGWGTVMGLKVERSTKRDSYGGATSGWRKRVYTVTCELVVISQLPHIETAGAGLDDLIDGMHGLIYADRTLGTTGGIYNTLANGRLIQQAGENPYGIQDRTLPWLPVNDDKDRGRYVGEAEVSFDAVTMVAA